MREIFNSTVINPSTGQAVRDPVITVYNAGTLTLATILDSSFAPKSNPFTGGIDGSFSFATNGGFFDIVASKGSFSRTWASVLILGPNSEPISLDVQDFVDQAEAAAADSVAAASASGHFEFFDTKAAADQAMPLPNDTIAEVAVDETRGNARTRYKVESGVLVFKVDLDRLRTDLVNAANGFGADLVRNAVRKFDNISEMQAATGLTDRQRIDVTSYYGTTAGPGGGPFVYLAGSAAVADDVDVFAATGMGGVGRIHRIPVGVLSTSDAGAVSDGVTNDNARVAAALATRRGTVTTPERLRVLVDAIGNPLGVRLPGPGSIVKAVSGGVQRLNSDGDLYQYVTGLEYMAAFHNLLITQHTTPTRQPIIVCSGDSTTAGDGVSADYQLDDLIKRAGTTAGLQTPFGLSVLNRGQSGQMTQQWVDTHLAGDLAANPDLLILRWGINDPGYLKSGAGAPLDAGQDFPDRRDINDFATSLRTGLATIRASRGVASLSILLMVPNSTSDTPNARDEIWYEQVREVVRQAARDYLCTFIDTYAFLRDSRPAANVWMDDPFGDGRAIHPLNVMNTWITGLMAEVIFPPGLRSKVGRNVVRNVGGAEDVGDSTRLPGFYEYGLTISRAVNSTAWPFDGGVVTVRSQDEIVIQINYPFRTGDTPRRFAYRMGRAITLAGNPAGWEPFQIIGDSAANVPAASGFALPMPGGLRTVASNSTVTIEGYVEQTVPGIIAANTDIANVPLGYRPVRDSWYGLATVFDGSNFETVRCRVSPDAGGGAVTLIEATTLSAQRVYVNAAWTTFA